MDSNTPKSENSIESLLQQSLEEHLETIQELIQTGLPEIRSAGEMLWQALSNGKKILLCGNGGSAADAQHIAAEFTNRFLIERDPLPALALTTDTSALTAIANDYDFTQVFSKQVKALGKAGDIALAISTSGNSPNVLAAVELCRQMKISTIGLTGGSGGKMVDKVDYLLRVSEGKNSARIQETHILVGHVICEIVDQKLFPTQSAHV